MLMPSIFGEDLFDDWMRLPVERENHRGYRAAELMKTDIKDVDGNYELSIDLPGFHKAGGFILELGHAAQLAEHGVAVQHPAQLGVGRNMRLDEQHVFLRVQTAGDIGRQLDQGVPPQLRRDLPHGDGVHVGHHIVAVILIRQRRPVSDGTQIGTQRQIAGGLDAA